MRFNKLDVPYQWKEQFTKYPHGYSIFEAMSKWVKQVNDMITNINQWNEYLSGFTSTFGEVPPQMAELQREMEALLSSVNSDLTNIMGEVTGLAGTLLSHLNDYATYLESELGEEHIIRELPNGTKDEIRVSGGKAELIKRVSDEFIITEDLFEGINKNLPNVDLAYTTRLTSILPNAIEFTTNIDAVYIQGLEQITSASADNVSSIGKFYTLGNPRRIYFVVAKGATLSQAREQLVGKAIIYQLAEPTEIPLPNPMTPNTREITRLSEQVDKLTNALIVLGGTII